MEEEGETKNSRSGFLSVKGFYCDGTELDLGFVDPSDFLGCGRGGPRRFHWFLEWH